MTVTIQFYDHSFIRVFGDSSIEMELKEEFSFYAPNYKYHPKYKARLWDGRISMYNAGNKRAPAGLLDNITEYLDGQDVEYELKGFPEDTGQQLVTEEELAKFIDNLNIHSRGQKIDVRDYQFDCIFKSINSRRLVSKVPTSGGKSLIIYCIIRWLLSNGLRFVLVVPNITLVNQMYSDFEDYSTENGFSVVDNCHKLFGGEAKEFVKPVLISTWQSISAMNKKNGKSAANIWNTYDAICIDEAHGAKSTEIVSLLSMMGDVRFRFGTTGTIPKDKSTEMTIIGHLGPIYTAITTKELIDKGQVVNIQIIAAVLKYDDESRRLIKDADYQREFKFVNQNQKRLSFIQNIANACEGTTLVLVQNVDTHAIPLYELIKATNKKPVYFVSGKIKAAEREEIRQKANKEDCIIVATYQTLSTGVNIPNIRNVIFGSFSKSLVRVLQSIGRGLRLHSGKSLLTLIDIVDDIKYKKKKNFALEHFEERLKIYQLEKFPIKIKEVVL